MIRQTTGDNNTNEPSLSTSRRERSKPPPPQQQQKQHQQQQRSCCKCGLFRKREAFSKTQWKKERDARCQECVVIAQRPTLPTPSTKNTNGGTTDSQQQQHPASSSSSTTEIIPTPISLEPRPQRAVPGLPGLTVCSDWLPPNTRTNDGQPPKTQSLIFNPLLACALGQQPWPGFCTAEQLDVAMVWWTQALPAWPRWTQQLQAALVMEGQVRDRLLASGVVTTKGGRCGRRRPNTTTALIPWTKGRGTVPHFPGKLQVECLELEPTVALEVYACVTCLYSFAAAATATKNSGGGGTTAALLEAQHPKDDDDDDDDNKETNKQMDEQEHNKSSKVVAMTANE
ncbi:hypothetical protein ACA910_018869 [Epithemia clementina (nom. ined.)]